MILNKVADRREHNSILVDVFDGDIVRAHSEVESSHNNLRSTRRRNGIVQWVDRCDHWISVDAGVLAIDSGSLIANGHHPLVLESRSRYRDTTQESIRHDDVARMGSERQSRCLSIEQNRLFLLNSQILSSDEDHLTSRCRRVLRSRSIHTGDDRKCVCQRGHEWI